MNDSPSTVPCKVALIECEDVRDVVNLHQGHEFGVVDLYSTYIMCAYQRSPDVIYTLVVWQERHCLLDRSNTPQRLIL